MRSAPGEGWKDRVHFSGSACAAAFFVSYAGSSGSHFAVRLDDCGSNEGDADDRGTNEGRGRPRLRRDREVKCKISRKFDVQNCASNFREILHSKFLHFRVHPTVDLPSQPRDN